MGVLSSRVRRLEERAALADDVERILDTLSHEQTMAVLAHFIAIARTQLGEGDGEPTDKQLGQSTPTRTRYEAALASLPEGTEDRLMAAFVRKIEKQEARAT
jgi:hypothetical protein